jgi:hypothetical protein
MSAGASIAVRVIAPAGGVKSDTQFAPESIDRNTSVQDASSVSGKRGCTW